ncbi:acyl-homoserine-lactone synthase [Vibrio metschnikovii]|uniref:acyl-homoserine-lactone synthase n=1 Tax=Vibrio metschnikovii TaxID=28172 RepID=UPI001C2F2F2F|nr:acyl-homoserine-lactone synthase [Vibrio metschnikovii]EKO3565913.1 acyl-homoserine-lactone synthase [Vibrio metschnikovii]EKO3770604.1 acyl-homoserine-lactone synthase [Vibrio metschnikovii]
MQLISSLRSLLTSTLPVDQKQQMLTALVINTYPSQQRTDLFLSVTDYRKQQLVALFPEHHNTSFSVLFELIDYRALIQRYPNTLSEEIALLEQIVGECYPHWLDFWCECEIATIKANSVIDTTACDIELPLEDNAYYGLLINQVEDSELVVATPSHPQKMLIKEAITLSNLELFIQGEKWYEMLPLLSLSQTGKHFVLLKYPNNGKVPVLVASMLVQDWASNQTWLSYAPQFSNPQWQFCLPAQGYDVFSTLSIFQPTLSKCDSLPEFDRQFRLRLSAKNRVCEVLRFTVSGNTQQKLYFLYLAQKKLVRILNQVGYKISFTIIEQPFILNFYNTIEPKAYFHSGYCNLNNDHKKTYRGFWIIEILDKVFSNNDFRGYKLAVRQSRQHAVIKKEEYA